MNMDILWRNVATQGNVGYGKAPGTIATVMMIPLVYFLGTLRLTHEMYLLIALAFVCFGCYIAHRALSFFSEADPSQIVIDEMVSFIALFCFLPITFKTIIIGCVLFRLFDIFKPFGISYLEQFPGAAGVMSDDLAAALMANVSLQLLFRLGWI